MRRLALAAAALALMVPLAAAPAADAISRQAAARKALRILKPQRVDGDVIVYTLRRPVGRRQTVIESEGTRRRPERAVRRSMKPAGRRAWLFWEDLLPGARFEHPSRLLLIDRDNGRVLANRRLSWYPVVGNRLPAFLTTRGADDRRLQVYSRVRNRRPRALASDTPAPAPLALPQGAFANDCALLIGEEGPDPKNFGPDFRAVKAAMMRYGVRTFDTPVAQRSADAEGDEGPGGTDLQVMAGRLARGDPELVGNQPCRDIFIFVAGHGAEKPNPASVEVGAVWTGARNNSSVVRKKLVRPADIGAIVAGNPNTTFKVKIESCYSGRFIEEIRPERFNNLLVMETSTNADQPGWGYKPRHPDSQNPEDESKDRINDRQLTGEARANAPGEFIHANIHGWEAFATSAAEVSRAQGLGGSLFAHMVDRAFELGAPFDFANKIDLTDPMRHSKLPREQVGQTPPQEPPPQPPPPPPSEPCSVTPGFEPASLDSTLTFDCANSGRVIDNVIIDPDKTVMFFNNPSHDGITWSGQIDANGNLRYIHPPQQSPTALRNAHFRTNPEACPGPTMAMATANFTDGSSYTTPPFQLPCQ